jgi:hypothetical protein
MSNQDVVFDGWNACAISGYEQSIIIMNEVNELEQNKPLVRFWCTEQYEKKTNI